MSTPLLSRDATRYLLGTPYLHLVAHKGHHSSGLPLLHLEARSLCSQLKISGPRLRLMTSCLNSGIILLTQRKPLKPGFSTAMNLGPPLIITTGSAFNSIAALRVATSISESQRGGMGSSALLHTLPITVLLQHIVDLMSGTPRGISQAELDET